MSYSLGKDIGLMPIKLENKYSTKELNEIHLKANELFYFYSTLFITDKAKEYLLEKILQLGNELKNIDWPLSKGKRKEEFRTKLGEIYKSLLNYKTNGDKDRLYMIESNMNKYLTSRFLKDKKLLLTDDVAFKWIKIIRQFALTYRVDSNLVSVQNECLEWLIVKKTLL